MRHEINEWKIVKNSKLFKIRKISVFKQHSNWIIRQFSIIPRPVNFSDMIKSVLNWLFADLGFWFVKEFSKSTLSRFFKVARSQQWVKSARVLVTQCLSNNVSWAKVGPFIWICSLASSCKIVTRVLEVIVATGRSQESVMKRTKFVKASRYCNFKNHLELKISTNKI